MKWLIQNITKCHLYWPIRAALFMEVVCWSSAVQKKKNPQRAHRGRSLIGWSSSVDQSEASELRLIHSWMPLKDSSFSFSFSLKKAKIGSSLPAEVTGCGGGGVVVVWKYPKIALRNSARRAAALGRRWSNFFSAFQIWVRHVMQQKPAQTR